MLDDIRVDIGDDGDTVPSGVSSHELLSTSHSDTLIGVPSNGALIVGTASQWVALVSGIENQSLMMRGGVIAWASGIVGPQGPIGPSGMPGFVYTTTTITSPNHTAAASNTILANASGNPIVVALPTASDSLDKAYFIKKIDNSSNVVTVSGVGGDTIDGEVTQEIIFQYDAIQTVSNGTAWFIL